MNSRYFHVVASARKRKNSFISLRNANGQWCTSSEEMEDLISHYFSHLFATTRGHNIEVLDCVEKKITDDQNSMLLAPFTENNVKVAFFDMHPDKSPGPDGMNSAFYQRFWNTVGEDVTNACLSFINNCSLPMGLNDTSIVLIPKKQKPEILSDMRLITLCNVLYKIVAKMLANRMKSVLGSVVSAAQSAFVPGRAITDNILISSEIMHFLKRKRQGKIGVTALKIDMWKAYDRIKWSFLKSMILRLGFDAK